MRAFGRPLSLPLVVVTTLLAVATITVPPVAQASEPQGLSSYPVGVTGGTFDAAGRLSGPDLADCDVERPAQQYVTFPSYAQTAAQICGIWSLENAATSAYDELHNPVSDQLPSALYTQAGYVQTFLQELAFATAAGSTDLTADQKAAYAWFLAVQQHYEVTVANAARAEYQRWSTQLCAYRPPSTAVFTYNPTRQPICNPDGNPGLDTLFTTLAPPTYANFVEYGRYDAEKTLGLTQQSADKLNQTLVDDGIVAGSGAVVAAIAGAVPGAISDLGAGTDALISIVRTIAPHNEAYFQYLGPEDQTLWEGLWENLSNIEILEEVGELEAVGAEVPAELEASASFIVDEVVDEAGVAAAALDAAEAGADLISGPLMIGTIAITIAMTQAINVFTAANIPNQLAADVSAASTTSTAGFVKNMLTANHNAKAAMVYANYRAQLQFPSPTVGVSPTGGASCAACVVYDDLPASTESVPARLHVTALNNDGTPTGWSTTVPYATFIDTWGMGVSNGGRGVPHVSVGVSGGKVWTKRESSSAATDDSEAGLSGWIPSGELHYFNAAGQPMIAALQGNQFTTRTSQGGVSAGGRDAGDDCATPGECETSSSIVVMGSGGTAQLVDEITGGTFAGIPCTANDPGTHDCFTDTITTNGKLVTAQGSSFTTSDGDVVVQQGTSHLYRLTLVPDTGTPATTWITNRYNTWANARPSGVAPDGGLVAGDTATFTAPDTSPAGYDTTYTWHVQTVCPADPDHPARTIQGVTVCSDNPDYAGSTLAANEQDLTTCTATVGTCTPAAVFGVTWNPDPAFHGGPVSTLSGQSVEWTWPAPGTYHLRLVTTDQYGVVKTSDRDVVVAAATPPRSALTYAAAADPQPRSVAPSVIGPVQDGNALTVTGCVVSPTTRGSTSYATPTVSVGWGDGTTPSTSADATVTLVRGAGGGCTTPWRWTATHTYAVPTYGQPFAQVPITVTTTDTTFPATASTDLPTGTSSSSTAVLYANVYAPTTPPTFVAGTSTTYQATAGQSTTVSGAVTSAIIATLTQSPATGATSHGAACAAGLPSGMGFQASSDNTFVITGTPQITAGGCYAITVHAVSTYGSADEQVVLDVAQAPAITSAASAGWATGGAHDSLTVTTTGFPAPSIAVTGVTCTTGCGSALPSDVTFHDNGDGTATLSGTDLSDDDTGVYQLTVKATSSSGTATQTLTLTIEGRPAFTSADSTGFTTGQAGTFVVKVSSTTTATVTCHLAGSDDHCMSGDGSRPYIDPNLAAGTGLSLVGSTTDGTMTITGIPAAAGSYPVTLTATNAVGSTTQTLTILVSSTGGATLSMVKADNLLTYTAPSGSQPASGEATFVLGQAGSVTLCSNVPGDTLTTQVVTDGATAAAPLPAGLSITSTSTTTCPSGNQQLTLSGTPTTPLTTGSLGSTAYRLVDAAGGVALLTLRLTGAPTFSSPGTATFTRGEAGTFTASLGTLRYASGTYSAGCLSTSSTLPAGLHLTAGTGGTATISGTPAASGRTTVTLTGTDCASASTQQTLTIDVRQAPTITSEHAAGFQVGAGGTLTVTTDDDSYPVPSLQVSGLPDGMAFTDHGDGTGTLTVAPDTPATTAPVDLTVTATSVAGSDTQQLRLAVGASPSITLPDAGGSVVLPRGVAASSTVSSTGTPTASLRCTVGATACASGALPSGLSFTDNGDGTATLAGTPTDLGSTSVTITAANGVGDPATTTLDVLVVRPASFAGTTTGASCAAASASATSHLFVAGQDDTWTICGDASPDPTITLQSVTCGGEPTNLPSGLAFSDAGDGSATVSGTAAIGSGSACRGGYTLTVAVANAGATVLQDLTLDVQEVLEWTTPTTTDAFVPGAPGAAVLGAAGSPVPAFSLDAASTLPSWLTLTDRGNGTAVLSGTAPASAAGTSVHLTVRVTNDDAEPLVEQVTVPVSTTTLTAATPPTASLGVAYSYRFEASAGVSFALADGSVLPDGLTLSPDGLLSGTPTELGRFSVVLALTDGGTTVTTGAILLKVGVGAHALEVSQFRTLAGSWFVQVVNTTAATVPLAGWRVGLQQTGAATSETVPLGTGTLAPGATALVTTSTSSLQRIGPTAFAAPTVEVVSGFEIVAPNGAVVDAAGVAGALPALVRGTGVSYPTTATAAQARYAFVRRGFADGAPVDTDDNAADFTFSPAVSLPETAAVPSTPTITAKVTSAAARSGAGWYRTPVTVTFTCRATTSPLATTCPAPVTLSSDGAGQQVARTVTAADGGTGSVTVTGINIDRSRPTVRITGVRADRVYAGKAPRARCVARDVVSGIVRCVITRSRHGKLVTYTAVATDKAGNTRRARLTTRVARYTFAGAPHRHGAFVVEHGKKVTLTAVSKTRPRLVAAVPAPGRPTVVGARLHRVGSVGEAPRWRIKIRFTRAQATKHHGRWDVGVRVKHTLHRVKVRVR